MQGVENKWKRLRRLIRKMVCISAVKRCSVVKSSPRVVSIATKYCYI